MAERIYRWQDAEGRGPYRPGVSRYWADEDQQANNPPMYIEFGADVVHRAPPGHAMGCGFRSIEQMQRWFSRDEQVRMRLLGYEFGSMEVDRVVAESDRQLVFSRRLPLRHGFTREAIGL
jgi:hypothetical protein